MTFFTLDTGNSASRQHYIDTGRHLTAGEIALAYPPSEIAIAEGWCIMLAGNGEWQIQRDDEQTVFASDDEAVSHVHACAEAGSVYHRACLAFVEDLRPVGTCQDGRSVCT